MTLREKTRLFIDVLGEILWRGFGLFLFILPSSMGVGAVVTGDIIKGVLVAWATLMAGIIGAVGYSIGVTGKASKNTVSKAAQDAVQKFEDKKEK